MSHAEVLRNLVEQAVLADQVGLAFIGVGEHHRKDFSVSAPEVKLDLFAALLEGTPVTWSGRTRPPLSGQMVDPPIEAGRLTTWIG